MSCPSHVQSAPSPSSWLSPSLLGTLVSHNRTRRQSCFASLVSSLKVKRAWHLLWVVFNVHVLKGSWTKAMSWVLLKGMYFFFKVHPQPFSLNWLSTLESHARQMQVPPFWLDVWHGWCRLGASVYMPPGSRHGYGECLDFFLTCEVNEGFLFV